VIAHNCTNEFQRRESRKEKKKKKKKKKKKESKIVKLFAISYLSSKENENEIVNLQDGSCSQSKHRTDCGIHSGA
jgi:hypothetical protein